MNAHDEKILGQLHPALREKVRDILAHVNAPGKLPPGLELGAHCGWRSPADQLKAFHAGASKLRRGAHNYDPARACDLVFRLHGEWTWASKTVLDGHKVAIPWWLIGYWAEEAGLAWGGRWGTPASARKVEAHAGMGYGWDLPHVELPGWASM